MTSNSGARPGDKLGMHAWALAVFGRTPDPPLEAPGTGEALRILTLSRDRPHTSARGGERKQSELSELEYNTMTPRERAMLYGGPE